MEFLVECEVDVPNGTPASEVEERTRAEASAAARLVDEGHLLRLWRRSAVTDDTTAIGLYAADSEAQLVGLLRAVPLAEWMRVTIMPRASSSIDEAKTIPSGFALRDPATLRAPRLIATVHEAFFGATFPTTRVTSLERDEERSFRTAPFARPYYICAALSADYLAPSRGLLAVSTWPVTVWTWP